VEESIEVHDLIMNFQLGENIHNMDIPFLFENNHGRPESKALVGVVG